jgi:hypothetical protein
MSVSYHARIARLEARQRQAHPDRHWTSVVRVPWDEPDQARWLRQLPCACGQVGCPERRIGLLVSEKAPSADAWAERAQAYVTRRQEGSPREVVGPTPQGV